jgi:CRISPR system Cascade subunit CasD
MDKYLVMWFEAPLQSWGADSKFGRRDSLPFPTKSGVAGLLLCAMGASGEQRELLERFSKLPCTVISFVRKNFNGGKTGKVLREPALRDFHMVGSGYNEKDNWEKMNIPKKADGQPAVGGGTKMTYRYYLQDAFFGVMLKAPAELSTTFAQALISPVYDLYFGRKSCVPTDFIYRGIYDTEEEAYQLLTTIIEEKQLAEDFRVLDGEFESGDVFTLNDVPVQFGENKKYRDRRVTVVQA